MKTCPRCNFKIQEEQTKCPNCDVIFAQWFAAHAPSPTDTPAYNFTSDIDLNRARMIAWVLVITSTVVCLAWMFLFFPTSYDPLAIPLIAAIPWIAIGLFRICGHLYTSDALYMEESPENNLFWLLAVLLDVPGVILFVSFQASFEYAILIDDILFIGLLVAGIFFMTGCLVWASPAIRNYFWIFVFAFFLIPYPAAVIKYINVYFDRSQPENFRATVLAKYQTEERRVKSTTFYDVYRIRVSPWGPIKNERGIEIDESLYQGLKVGQPICFHLHPGKLGIRWYAYNVGGNTC